MQARFARTGALVVTVLVAAGCTSSAQQPVHPTTARQPGVTPGAASPIGTPEVLVDHLDTPWGVAFLPGGDALVGERDSGRILRVSPTGSPRTVTSIDVSARGESGLLGLAVSPHFGRDHFVYAYYTSARDNRLVRFTLHGTTAGPLRPLLTGVPEGAIHDGGRIAFGPDGMLYIGTGETGDDALAQDRGSLAGKILRIRPDGSVPADNPFPGSPVWTLGHRNVQGLAWDADGRMFATEFGPDRADEINRIRPGQNYGWPDVVGTGGTADGYTDPLISFPTEQNSASGLAITAGALWTGALRGERLWRIPERADGSLGTPQPLLVGRYGRLRTVVVAPDGALWVTTSNTDGRGQPSAADDLVLRITVR